MNLKKLKQFRVVFALISTNLFLFLAISFSKDSDPKINIRLNHKTVLLPIEMYVPQNHESDGKLVTLYDDLNNIVVKRAFIYSKENNGLDQNGNLYKVEIEDKDLIKIINFKGKVLKAFPQMEDSIKQDSENYELVF